MKKIAFYSLSLLVAATLCGCGMVDGMFGGGAAPSAETPAAPASPGIAAALETDTPQTQPPLKVASSDPQVSDINCPRVELRPGAETLRSFAAGVQGAPADMKWQANITNVARECSVLGVEVGMKVGVAGRMLLGPKGQPGTYAVPVRITVARTNSNEALWGRVLSVQVTIPPDAAAAPFSVIAEDILFPRDSKDDLSSVQVIAGFDANMPKEAKPKGKVRRAKH